MAKDFQKQKVYDFEKVKFALAYKIKMSENQCNELIHDVCRCYEIPSPRIEYPEYQGNASFQQGNRLSILFEHKNKATVLHEVAHYVNYLIGNNDLHGEKFFSIYAYLMSQYCGLPVYEILHKASTQFGIKYSKDYPVFKHNPNPDLTKLYYAQKEILLGERK